MNIKRFILAAIAVFFTFQILDFVVHSLILGSCYQSESMMNVWRPDMMSLMWVMYLTSLVLSVLFVFIYTKFYSGKRITEGLRYGIIMGLLISTGNAFNQYVIYPITFDLAVNWFVFGLLEFIVAGIVVALIYKPANK